MTGFGPACAIQVGCCRLDKLNADLGNTEIGGAPGMTRDQFAPAAGLDFDFGRTFGGLA